MNRLLVVTAVGAERDAVAAGYAATCPGPGPHPLDLPGWSVADGPRTSRPPGTVEASRTGKSPGAPAGLRISGSTDAPVAGLDTTIAAVGVGPVAAAAGTARLLALAWAAGRPYQAVVSAGIGGGFAGRIEPGGIALASVSIAADLGADSPNGFLPLDRLGFGTVQRPVDATLLARLAEALPSARTGPVLTVSTVTGTVAGQAALTGRYPEALAEGMEGFGVATAAGQAGVPFAEVRTISNPVGPRDRAGWRIDAALEALAEVGRALGGGALGKLDP